MRAMGVDPGKTGAWVVVERVPSGPPGVVASGLMPLMPGPGGRTRLDARELLATLRQAMADAGGVRVAVLEEPSAMPRQGIASAFGFGRTLGATEAVLVSLGLALELVRPNVWKRELRVPADKGGARARASQLMPGGSGLWRLAKEDGVAEAAMLALWGLDRLAPTYDLFGGGR